MYTQCNSFFLTPLKANELIIQMNSLKIGIKAGEDNITSEIMKNNHKHLLKPLLHIVNRIFCTGIYPNILKGAITVPVYKGGNKKLTTNYRPIALVSTIGKLIEKCIKLRLVAYLEKYKIVSNNQFAFKRNTGTEEAMCNVTEKILKYINDGERVIAIFLDIAKAFDTVAHSILLERLHDIGIRGTANNLFRSYLSNRTQKVQIGQVMSEPLKIESGVPQGTVLGPVLFTLYINEVLSVLDEGDTFCYADDTAIIMRSKTWEMAYKKAELALSKIKEWFDESMLTLNVSKTKFITFGLTQKTIPFSNSLKISNTMSSESENVNEDGCTVERVRCIKYLGVYIDECLTWREHIHYVTDKIQKLIYKFVELRQIVSVSTLKILLKMIVEQGSNISAGLYSFITMKLIIFLWLYFTIIFCSVLKSQIASILIKPETYDFRTIEDLSRNDFGFALNEGLKYKFLAKYGWLGINSLAMGKRNYEDVREVCPATSYFFQNRIAIVHSEFDLLVGLKQCISYFPRDKVNDLRFFTDRNIYYALAMNPLSPYRKQFTLNIDRLKSSGIMTNWYEYVSRTVLKQLSKERPLPRPLEIDQTSSFFILLLVGLGIGFSVLILEIIEAVLNRKYNMNFTVMDKL